MCTVTWVHQPGGYVLFCNRDEKKARPPALPPLVGKRNGVSYIAPIDASFGGTWLALNDRGVTFCLLNGDNGPRTPGLTSRGLLVMELVGCTGIESAVEGLDRMDLTRFAPFVLAIVEPGRQAAVANWNAQHLTANLAAETCSPLTSSSFDTERVRAARRRSFEALHAGASPDPVSLARYHATHDLSEGALGVCMHRADAETVHFSRVDVDESSVRLSCSPAAPCQAVPPAAAGSLVIGRQ